MINLQVKAEVKPLIQRLEEAFEEAKKETREALNTCAAMVRDKARILCPVDTGSLKKSIRIGRRESNGPLYSISVSAGDAGVFNPKTGKIVNYAKFVEYGTSRIKAQPFLRLALALARPLILAIIRNAWRKALEKEAHA